MYTDHTLPSDIMTVDAYDSTLDTYFAREGNYPTYVSGIKSPNEMADLEKSTRN